LTAKIARAISNRVINFKMEFIQSLLNAWRVHYRQDDGAQLTGFIKNINFPDKILENSGFYDFIRRRRKVIAVYA
jgi:hypothetical protein